jgi:hypothetical protein
LDSVVSQSGALLHYRKQEPNIEFRYNGLWQRIDETMEHAEDFATLPLVDDEKVKDVFAEFCTGLNSVHGNVHMTFASVTADHSSPRASSKRIVSARIVMPIIGAIERRDLLTQLIDALTAQGVITRELPPTIVVPPGRPH